jgi:alpha-glucosidase
VEKQLSDTESTLALFRQALELRRSRPESGEVGVEWLTAPEHALIFRRRDGGLVCALNAGDQPLALPAGEVILSSAALTDGALPPNAAAWLV